MKSFLNMSVLIAAIVVAPCTMGAVEDGGAASSGAVVTVAAPGKKSASREVKVTSDRSSYLRKDGIIAFEGNVCVDDVEFKMHADEVTLFLQGTNDLRRVIAIGNVVVTNETRVGTCAKATYNKKLAKVVLLGDEKTGVLARLEDNGKRHSSVEGRKITFWIDTEQVEVEKSTVTVDAGGAGGKDSLKDLLKK